MSLHVLLYLQTRKMHGINVQGTIIILDEAHNIVSLCNMHTLCLFVYVHTLHCTVSVSIYILQEKVCEESASFDLTSTDISLCISDVDTILKAKKEEQELSSEGDET